MAALRGRVGTEPEAAQGPHLVPPRTYPGSQGHREGLRARISLAALVCVRPGQRTQLIYRMLTHTGRKGEKKGFRERDLAMLLDTAHQQLGGPLVLVWDNATQHKDTAMRELLQARST